VNKKSPLSAFLTAILIAGLALASATRFGTVQASTDVGDTSKPSVPDFTVRYVDLSYDVPPTYGTDQFTGETVITQEGYHVDNQSVAFRIKNQPFTSYNDSSGNIIALYYNFRFKGHFTEEWQYYPFSDGGTGTRRYSAMFYVLIDSSPKLAASDSEFTEIFLDLPLLFLAGSPPVGSQVDFQVQALTGHIDYEGDGYYSYTGQRSDWSSTQTITVGEGQTPTPSPATTPTPAPAATSSPSPIPVPGQSFFFVKSNSTVSELFFNSTSAELSFTVSGEPETAGYVEVTIAKSLVSNVQNVRVYLDGNQLDVAITDGEDSWLLSFNYVHSTHHVRISLAATAATTQFLGVEYWIWIAVAVIAAVIGAGLLVYFNRRRDHTTPDNAKREVGPNWTK
jgi:hypothetical protein